MASAVLVKMSDRDDIQELLAQYSLLLEEEGAFESWLQLFTEDADFHIFGQDLHGRSGIANMLSGAPHGVHLMGLPAITLEGGRARSTVNFVFFPHEGDARTMGWYFDSYSLEDGSWRISEHTVQMCTPTRAQFKR
jgi:3-phenylpropionate/cinnamic acid dioxygenase small subunit